VAPAEVLRSWRDGRAKLLVTARLLALRRRFPELLVAGGSGLSGGEASLLDETVDVYAFNTTLPDPGWVLLRQFVTPEAIDLPTLKVRTPTEGLVGQIAASGRAVNLADAQESPHFAYRPETGEEEFHSMLGVPILRGGRGIGVLAVQNRTQRHCTD